jgi:hypothetical protein
MKIIISLLLICSVCLMATPVDASSFGISPAIISLKAIQGSSSTFPFIVSSYSGLVEISSEGMPVTISPSSVNAIAGQPIQVVISCNGNANLGTYDGRIKFLAKSGGSVMAGINVICDLIVAGGSANITLTTTVVGNTQSNSWGGGGGIGTSRSVPYTPPDWESMFPSMRQQPSSSPVDDRPVATNPPTYNPPIEPYSNMATESTTPAVAPASNPPTLDKAVIAGIVLWAVVIGAGIWGLSWLVDKRRKKVQ